jgi:uncharacterized protein YdhG (YjbR/CyaY superfamily)
MTSTAKTVDDYLNEVPEDRKDAIIQFRKLCLSILKNYKESMEYGMPTYRLQEEGEASVAFASQKNNIALYILKKDVLDRHRINFAKSAIGKGCIRYTNPNKIDFDLVETMLKESFESDAEICP